MTTTSRTRITGDRGRPDHDRGDPQRAQLGRRRDERDLDPVGLHAGSSTSSRTARSRCSTPSTACSGSRPGLPIFLGNLEVCTRVTEEMYGREAWQRGRRLDHERLLPGGHAPQRHHGLRADLPSTASLSASPPRAPTGSTSGAKDAGAPMDSTEIYQEGLRLGPTKVVEGGRERRDVDRPARPQLAASPTPRSAT